MAVGCWLLAFVCSAAVKGLLLVALVFVGCHSGKSAKSKAYVEDLERICNAEAMSGADELDQDGRSLFIAVWLANNLVTQEARDLMAKQARLPPKEKAALFRAEAREAGLPDCPIADALQ